MCTFKENIKRCTINRESIVVTLKKLNNFQFEKNNYQLKMKKNVISFEEFYIDIK